MTNLNRRSFMVYKAAIVTLSIGAMFLTSCSPGTAGRDPVRPALREVPEHFVIGADHHIHIQSDEIMRSLTELSEHVPAEFRRSMDSLPPVDAEAIINELDAAGIRMAAVLSAGFIAEMPEAADIWDDATRRSINMSENDYAAHQVALYPDRLRLFCSVNPLTDYAVAEITRCQSELGATGVKLHFATSGVDLQNQQHLEQISTIAAHAAALGMPLAIHLANRNEDFGVQDVENFIGAVVVGNENLELYLLHMAGWGSSGSDPHAVLDAWISALDGGVISGRRGIYFETSGSYTRRIDNTRLAEQIDALGADRVFFGSDWPAILRPTYAAINFWTHVPLDEETLLDILDNRALYFEE